MKKIKTLAAVALLALASINAQARNVTLGWDYEPDSNVLAFIVTYFQEGAGTQQTVTVNPLERTATITITPGHWDAYVVAVGNTGIHSDPSNTLDIFQPIPPANLRIIVTP